MDDVRVGRDPLQQRVQIDIGQGRDQIDSRLP